MTPEREQREPDHISFEEVISNATEIMLQDGQHVPVVIMDTNTNIFVGQIPNMPATHKERVELMSFLGEAAGKSGRVDQLQQVFMVSEGWLSIATENKQAELRPSQDPERKEVLIVSNIQIQEHKKRLKVFEILRNNDEQVVGLQEIMPDKDPQDQTVDIPLLDAFVQGFQMMFRIRFN